MKRMNTDKKLKILWFILSLLILALLITMIVIMGGKKGAKSKGISKPNGREDADNMTSEAPTEVIGVYNNKDTDAGLVKEADNSELQRLVENYYAAKLAGDMDMLGQYVDDMSNIKEEDIKKPNKYIEAYKDIECYVVSGKSSPIIVLVKLDYKYYNIDTPAPCIVYLQAVYKDDEKKYYIHNMTAGDEVNMYISSITAKDSVKDMENQVEMEFKAACEKDENLRNLYELMHE